MLIRLYKTYKPHKPSKQHRLLSSTKNGDTPMVNPWRTPIFLVVYAAVWAAGVLFLGFLACLLGTFLCCKLL